MNPTRFEFTSICHEAADRAFQAYDFGDKLKVESADGWETDGSRDVSRMVYVDEGDDTTFRVSFHVLFANNGTADIEDVYGLIMNNGAQIGSFPIQVKDFNEESATLYAE